MAYRESYYASVLTIGLPALGLLEWRGGAGFPIDSPP
jgi:hypothetical protein